MLDQFESMKKQYPDCILFFRLGDFYEMFNDDAVEGSKLLNIALTGRHKGENRIPMCGVPHHAVNYYLAKLTKAGKKVAICEQMSDPKLPGLVQREVVRVVTPGTTFDEHIVDQKTNNYLIAVYPKDNYFGLAYADLTTGEFAATEIAGYENLTKEINRLRPSECIINAELLKNANVQTFLNTFKSTVVNPFQTFREPYQTLTDHFKTKNLEGFGLEKLTFAIEAAGLLLNYLQDTQKTTLHHITRVRSYTIGEHMTLDEATLYNLELLQNNRAGSNKDGALLSVLDQTATPMGGRLLKKWIIQPLLNVAKINYRLDGVDELFKNQSLVFALQTDFKNIMDIERILGRLSVGHGNARDLLSLKNSLTLIPTIKERLTVAKSKILQDICQYLVTFPELTQTLETAIVDQPPLSLKEGGMIKDGFCEELDELKKISRDGKHFLNELQEREIKRSGINSLKVRFNKVFGYYIEISKANLKHAPADYIRKQTLVNAERFITPELKEYEEKILGAEEKIMALEYELFLAIRDKVLREVENLQKAAQTLATLDVLMNFAQIALTNNYVRPIVNEAQNINIKDGRHPVIEKSTAANNFIPNDLDLKSGEREFILLTGPNMSGKSTYLRQLALIVLMAQIGSFVPAKEAQIGLVDRIFTRVGASDNLMAGQSTFMVEMQEAANILHHATNKSLIILDEIGRGTSTYDGVSIAWAMTEYIHDHLQAKTIFATHYHELIALAEKLPRAKNYSVLVRENETEGVVFLHKVVAGAIDKSYGIEVAKLAGLPKAVTDKAYEVLRELEEKITRNHIPPPVYRRGLGGGPRIDSVYPLVEELKKIDINQLTPLQGLAKLEELKKKLAK